MGSWSSATYVNHGDLDTVEHSMTELFAKEDMHLTPRPPERQEMRYAPMQYHRAAENDLWAVALLPGRDSWTIIRTAPFNLLCERAVDADRIRLVSLAELLDCNALSFNMRGSSQGILIEASRTGEYTLAGFVENPARTGASTGYYDEPYSGDEHCQVYFRIVDPDEIARPEASAKSRGVIRALAENPYPNHRHSPTHEEMTIALADALGGPNAEEGQNHILVNVLIPNKELHIPGGRALYFARR